MSINDTIQIVLVLLSLIVCWRIQFPRPKVRPYMKRRLVSDVVKLIQETKSRKQKVDIIKTNLSQALVGILRLNFDSTLELDIDLDLPFDFGRNGTPIQSLSRSSVIWKSFLKTAPHPRSRKNIRLKVMIEGLEPVEAKLFLDAAARKLDLGISRFTLRRCFPEIFKAV